MRQRTPQANHFAIRRPVLVTGCSSGVGRAAALAFSAAGLRTFATGRRLSALEDLRQYGCEILPLDVDNEESRCTAVAEIERRCGPIAVLVNNAGYPQYGPIEEVPLDAIRRQFETNVIGLIRMCQLVLPGMRRAGGGRIINVSSVSGRVTSAGGGIYHASKYAVEAIADALRPEVKPFGIDVVNVLPGPIATDFLRKLLASIPQTGADSPYATFKAHLAERMRAFLKPDGLGVLTADDVARVIMRAATAPRPRTRYNVGFVAKLGPVGRALVSDRLVDAVMARSMPHR